MAVNEKPPAIGANGAMLHHVSLPVRDVARSVGFYRDVLGLTQIPRPDFDFKGASSTSWLARRQRQPLSHLKPPLRLFI